LLVYLLNCLQDDVIPIHNNFTLWVLANRPGRKFHGNNLHASIGDCFRSHVIPNPDLDSEIELLRSYAPKTDRKDLSSLAKSFAELRQLFESGDISYPYSTREAVAIVKHFEQFPDGGLAGTLHNVIDLDSFDENLYQRICSIFKKNGLLPHRISHVGDKRMDIQYIENESSAPPTLATPKKGTKANSIG
jgi:von Willebrand factor A domain-containing protein 8